MPDPGRRDGGPITVLVEELEYDPIDIERWVKRYVAIALEVEGVKPRIDPPTSPE